MTTHPAAYIDWVCPGCKTLYEVDPMHDLRDEVCDSCEPEPEEERCDCAGCLRPCEPGCDCDDCMGLAS